MMNFAQNTNAKSGNCNVILVIVCDSEMERSGFDDESLNDF